MSNLPWQKMRNVENSLVEFLQDAVSTASLTIIDENGNTQNVLVRAGFKFNDDWELPVISVYVDTKTATRLSVGSNRRANTYLVIIDIRSLDKGSQLDLTEWVQETINDGAPFYVYTPNPGDPDNPTKVQNGIISVDFISNVSLRLGDGAEIWEKYRQNITLSCTISNS